MSMQRTNEAQTHLVSLLLVATLCAAVTAFASCANPAAGTATGVADLAAGTVSFQSAATNATEGGTLPVSFTVNNLKSTSMSASSYSVAFFMASSGTFSPSSNELLSPTPAPTLPTVPANGSATINATLAMPSGSSATAYLSQCDYIYAVVTASGDTNTSNDTTSAADSLVVFFAASTSPTNYPNLVVETYSPDGGSYSSNTFIAIYDSAGNNKGYNTSTLSYGSVTPTTTLTTGTYYIAILNNGSGPYALDVRTTNVSHQTFSSSAPVVASNSNDVSPQLGVSNLSGNVDGVSPDPSLPSSGTQALTLGTAVNFYGPNGNTEWFTFTLP